MDLLSKITGEPITLEEATAAFETACSGNWSGAYLLLEHAGADAPPGAIYNKTLCLLQAGQPQQALDVLLIVMPDMEKAADGRNKGFADPALHLLQKAGDKPQALPHPLHPLLARKHSDYAALLARWLLTVCYNACGRQEEARQAARPLEKYQLRALEHLWETQSDSQP